MHHLITFYFRTVLLPFIWVLIGSLLSLVVVLTGIAWVEAQRHRPTVFDLEIVPLGRAPVWILLLAGMLIMNGLVMARWALITADVGRRYGGDGYELNIPLPLARIVAANVLYIGLTVLVFYLLRSVADRGF